MSEKVMRLELRGTLLDGLCGTCQHRREVSSQRSVFVRCARSEAEPEYPRYPLLPVLRCPGWEAVGSGAESEEGDGRPRGGASG